MVQIPLVLTDRDQLQDKIKHASEELYKVAKAAYGPGAGNVVLGFKHGAPMLSRDGITNMSQVRLEEPFEDDIVQAILQVSQKNNSRVGDGTTAVVILTHHLLLAAQRMEGKGINPMVIAKKLKEAEKIALKYIESLQLPANKVTNDILESVATIASGDKEVGKMICDIMKEIGKDGGTMIEQYEGLGIRNEVIDGFYFHKGYKDTELILDPATNQSNHKDVPILISSKKFDTEVDIAPIIQSVVQSGFKQLVIIGQVDNAALEVLKLTKSKGILMAVPVDPPFVAGGQSLFLDDIALMVGSEVYNGVDFSTEKHLGMAKETLVTEHATSILGGDGEKKIVKERIKSLRSQVKELEHPQSIQFVKDRLARLTGKMAIIRVGGATELERDELKERVRDAVCAVQSAMKEGVLPGGGTALARVRGTEFDDAFKQPFKQLVENAAENPDAYLAKLDVSKEWQGFNLVRHEDEPTDLLKEGVIDAFLVVKETITNSVSMAANLITASAAVAYKEKQ